MRDLSPAVRDFAKSRNLTPQQVRTMVRWSAVCDHEHGNRRYQNYVFRIDGRNIVSMVDLESGLYVTDRPTPVLREGEFIQYEECEPCEGKGCARCNYEGEVRYVRRMSKAKSGPMR